MKIRTSLCFPFLFCGVLAAATPRDAVRILQTAPLRFEPAADDGSAQFVARGARFRFSFTGNQASFQAGDKNARLQFQGAAPQARIEAIQKLPSTTGLFFGNDPSKWRPSIPNYGRLQVRELYRGIDLVYYGNAGELEYDLTVQPGADPGQIRLRLDGSRARVDRDGNLVAGLIQKRPIAYQMSANGARLPVESRYRKNADGSYGFVLGQYDRDRELVIDPVLSFSLYLSGGLQDIAQGIGLDKSGFLYVAGTTFSTDIKVTNSIQTTNKGGTDLFVAKIDPNAAAGKQIVFYTYLGGGANDTLGGMAVGPNGDVYLTGTTLSGDFPTVNPAQSALSGTSDAFVVWINSSRKLGYSSYLGGTKDETGVGITFDSKGKIFVTGGTESTDFPTASPFQSANAGRQDAFVAMIDPALSGSATLAHSSYFGGGGWDIGRGIALAADGTVWVAGGTYSNNLPKKGNSFQPAFQGFGDAFVAHINPSAGSSGLEYVTYLGGSDQEEAKNVVVDAEGRVIVSGYTTSTNFPVTANAMQTKYGGNTDAFISILDPAQTNHKAQLVYSTYFGGNGADVPFDLKLDAAGDLYLCGITQSGDLTTTPNAAQLKYDGSVDAFALKFTPATAGPAAIGYLSYLGSDGLQVGYGIDFDAKDHIYMVGYTSGPIFSAIHGVSKPSAAGNVDGFVIGLNTK
jgi:Beta-propeller repeat